MFGLTRREQRWKAEQQAAELLVGLATAAINARVQIAIAEAQSDRDKELAELRAEVAALREKQGDQHEKDQ